MRHDTSIDLSGSGTLARRQMVKVLASVGVGVVARPLMSPLAAAAEIGNSTSMVAAIFFESYATIALRRALRYAGDDGFVASMPALLHARVNASYNNIIWNTWFTANSEENVNHIPDKYEHLVHYYGYYSNRSRGARRLIDNGDGIARILNHLTCATRRPKSSRHRQARLSRYTRHLTRTRRFSTCFRYLRPHRGDRISYPSDLGHKVYWWPDWIWRSGAVCCIAIDQQTGVLQGGADPRRPSYAVGW